MFKTNLQKAIERNGDYWEYNCGGFALGTFNWFLPHSFMSYRSYLRTIGGYEETKVLAATIPEILKVSDTIRRIDSMDELKQDEYAIAYRVCSDDFHFRLCYNGEWYEKMGDGNIHKISAHTIFTDCWFGGYDSAVVLFAEKKKIFREVA